MYAFCLIKTNKKKRVNRKRETQRISMTMIQCLVVWDANWPSHLDRPAPLLCTIPVDQTIGVFLYWAVRYMPQAFEEDMLRGHSLLCNGSSSRDTLIGNIGQSATSNVVELHLSINPSEISWAEWFQSFFT